MFFFELLLIRAGDVFRRKRLGWGAVGRIEKKRQIIVDEFVVPVVGVARRKSLAHGEETSRALDVGRRALRQRVADGAPVMREQPVLQNRALNGGQRFAARQTKRLAQSLLSRRIDRQAVARLHRGADQRVEIALRGVGGDAPQGCAERARIACGLRQGVAPGLVEPFRLFGVFRDREAGRNIRLERKQMQQAFAEGVDCLDFQPARRLHRACEQPPRRNQRRSRRLVRAGRANGRAQGVVVEARPTGEDREDALRHIRRRRLGEGEAENAGRIDAVEHEPHDALRQHMRLAGASVGRHPDRAGRIGGEALALQRVRGDGAAHASSPLSPAAHSLTRARWSYSAKRDANCG